MFEAVDLKRRKKGAPREEGKSKQERVSQGEREEE